MEPIFPIEILSEIANVYPFTSFMRYLNRETRKYWNDRTVNLDLLNLNDSEYPEWKEKNLTPDLVIATKSLGVSDIPKYKLEIIKNAKYLQTVQSLFISREAEKYASILPMPRINAISFGGGYAYLKRIPIDLEKIRVFSCVLNMYHGKEKKSTTSTDSELRLLDKYDKFCSDPYRLTLNPKDVWYLIGGYDRYGDKQLILDICERVEGKPIELAKHVQFHYDPDFRDIIDKILEYPNIVTCNIAYSTKNKEAFWKEFREVLKLDHRIRFTTLEF